MENGLKALELNSEIMFFSDMNLEESENEKKQESISLVVRLE